MKTSLYLLALLLIAGLMLTLNACKKETVDPSTGLSTKIQNIVPAAALADLKAKGLVVNEGSQPPSIEGAYLVNPMRLQSPYGPNDGYYKGQVIGDYRYRFYGQVGDEVKLDYKNSGSDVGTGQGAFLSGFGNKFTLFIESTGIASGINYKAVKVISGEVTTQGIVNFQEALILTQKTGDTSNTVLIPLNQARVWEDGSQLASKITTFRLATPMDEPSQTTSSAGNR